MPVWHERADTMLKGVLREVWEDLDHQIQDDPPFSEVTGLTADQMVSHATEAVGALLKTTAASPADPQTMIQLYCMAFVIGVKYGERRVSDSTTKLPPGGSV